MKPNISKAQLEVWEWKNALHEEIKNMGLEEGLDYLLKKSRKVALEMKKTNIRKSMTKQKD
ncbi:MAG: hypothetical protein HYZ34_05635 [Ignavibacteriae bacterium]|nr:hypothetical protein [Ignavibacteriota bacterium]